MRHLRTSDAGISRPRFAADLFNVRADQKLTAFIELESGTHLVETLM
jgi:hypothetical protein